MGEEKCVDIKFERVFDFYYGCGKPGHPFNQCHKDVIMSSPWEGRPLYGPSMNHDQDPMVKEAPSLVGIRAGRNCNDLGDEVDGTIINGGTDKAPSTMPQEKPVPHDMDIPLRDNISDK